MSNLSIIEMPPQVREITVGHAACDHRDYFRIALPSMHLMPDPPQTLLPFFCVRDKIFASIPGPIGFAKDIPRNCDDPEMFFWNDPRLNSHFNFPINKNLCIKTFKQWHDLTRENPDFMREQFDLEFYCELEKPNFWIVLRENPYRYLTLPRWMSSREARLDVNFIEFHPSRRRSISIVDDRGHKFISIFFPELTIVEHVNGTLCLTRVRDNIYVPLPMPNVSVIGIACLGHQFRNFSNSLRFWNSAFTQILAGGITINKELFIESWDSWVSLAEHSPDFMIEQFDPKFAEESSPVTYTIDLPNRKISWRFRS